MQCVTCRDCGVTGPMGIVEDLANQSVIEEVMVGNVFRKKGEGISCRGTTKSRLNRTSRHSW